MGAPRLTAERLDEIEQRVRDASERGPKNWYKVDVPDLLHDLRVVRERAERLGRAVDKLIARYDHAKDDCEGLCMVERRQVVEDFRAVLAEQEKEQP